jgi:hypothetical protein
MEIPLRWSVGQEKGSRKGTFNQTIDQVQVGTAKKAARVTVKSS